MLFRSAFVYLVFACLGLLSVSVCSWILIFVVFEFIFVLFGFSYMDCLDIWVFIFVVFGFSWPKQFGVFVLFWILIFLAFGYLGFFMYGVVGCLGFLYGVVGC